MRKVEQTFGRKHKYSETTRKRSTSFVGFEHKTRQCFNASRERPSISMIFVIKARGRNEKPGKRGRLNEPKVGSAQ